MDPIAVTNAVDKQEWLQPLAEKTQGAVAKIYGLLGPAGPKIKDFLHGTWLGHPLHAIMVNAPIGAFGAATVLDVVDAATDSDTAGKYADAAVAVGLVGAGAAAVSGLTDWHEIEDKPVQRVGMTHALLNVAATGLYGASLVARLTGKRKLARTLGWAGYGVLVASAYFGGTLVYEEKIGADHAPRKDLPQDWVAVLPERELGEGQLKMVEAQGFRILLVRQDGKIYALGNTCAHFGGPLNEGQLEGGCVVCPWHGSKFSLETGRVVQGPSVFPQPKYDVRVANGQIEVKSVNDSAAHNALASV